MFFMDNILSVFFEKSGMIGGKIEMKKYYILLLFPCILFISCGKKEEPKLITFNPVTYAFKTDGGWDVQASIQVKGFTQKKEKDTYIVKMFYSVDLVKPDGNFVNGVVRDTIDEENTEEFMDLPVNVQFELDSSYTVGNYKVIYNIKDAFSNQQIKSEKDLELTE
jgi:hypothetical protein